MRLLRLLTALSVLSAALGCATLDLHLHNASVQKPSNVALYYTVETGDGAPVGGLQAESFRIYEDDQLISPFESKQTILNPEIAVEHFTLLLLDLSGSITESGSMHALMSAASSFSEKITKTHKMGVWGFDGSPRIIPVIGFTSSPGAVSRGLAVLSNRKPKDPSTNLNGAVVEALKELEKALARSQKPLRFGTLIVFTDGTDRAHRVSVEEMEKALDEAKINVFSIGLGAEISEDQLSALGRQGFVKADEQGNIGKAFDEIAARIDAASRKFYLLSYCSPSRAGKHRLRVEVTAEGATGSVEYEFDAAGFGPNCDPNRKPNFPIGRITYSRAAKK